MPKTLLWQRDEYNCFTLKKSKIKYTIWCRLSSCSLRCHADSIPSALIIFSSALPGQRQVLEKWCRCGGSIELISVERDSLREEKLNKRYANRETALMFPNVSESRHPDQLHFTSMNVAFAFTPS